MPRRRSFIAPAATPAPIVDLLSELNKAAKIEAEGVKP